MTQRQHNAITTSRQVMRQRRKDAARAKGAAAMRQIQRCIHAPSRRAISSPPFLHARRCFFRFSLIASLRHFRHPARHLHHHPPFTLLPRHWFHIVAICPFVDAYHATMPTVITPPLTCLILFDALLHVDATCYGQAAQQRAAPITHAVRSAKKRPMRDVRGVVPPRPVCSAAGVRYHFVLQALLQNTVITVRVRVRGMRYARKRCCAAEMRADAMCRHEMSPLSRYYKECHDDDVPDARQIAKCRDVQRCRRQCHAMLIDAIMLMMFRYISCHDCFFSAILCDKRD